MTDFNDMNLIRKERQILIIDSESRFRQLSRLMANGAQV